MINLGWLGVTILVLDWTIRVALSVRIITRRRALPTTLSWLVIVFFLPIFGAVLYLLLGETRLGTRRHARYRELTAALEQQGSQLWKHRHFSWEGGNTTVQQIARYGDAVGGSPPLRGNALRLVHDTDAMIDGIAQDIDDAKAHCHLLFYIWQAGGRSVVVGEALVRAAQRGVACRVLVDAVGSKEFLRSAQAARMREAGVQVVAALPVNPVRMLLARMDLRNHRKIVAIDGRVAWAGSQNLTDTTFKLDQRRGIGPWVDAMVRIEGPAAQALDVVFLCDWQLDAPEKIDDVEPFLPVIPRPENDHSVVQVIPSGPGATPEAIHQALLTAIYTAREEIIMTTPYFVPDESTRTALQAAATRGVHVTIVLPARNDSPLVAAASRSFYLDLLEAGAKIMHFRQGLLHAKTVTIDRDIAIIGSANFDMRSFWLNYEVTLGVYDSDFASMLRFLQKEYMNGSNEVRLQDWRARPFPAFMLDNAARMLAPLL